MPRALLTPLIFVVAILAHFVTPAPSKVIAVVLAHDRITSLRKTLRSFADAAPPHLAANISLYVSVDDSQNAQRVLETASSEPLVAGTWHHLPPPVPHVLTVRERIARHYHYALSRAFSPIENPSATHAILLEDDLLFAPDYLSYTLSAIRELAPPAPNATVCASAWNDNGRRRTNPAPAHLTTFFPGLGWALTRQLWESVLRDAWPGERSRALVGVGWDFWMRVLFEREGWACVVPSVPRVFHLGAGSNVGAAEKEQLFDASVLADAPVGAVDWPAVLRDAADAEAEAVRVQKALAEARTVGSVREAIQLVEGLRDGDAPLQMVLPYLRENYQREVAKPLMLWPTPRGHFRHVLAVALSEAATLLLYDARRGARYFPRTGAQPPRASVVVAERNASCVEACAVRGLACSSAALEDANGCKSLAAVMPGACAKGCAYETGGDLPAWVVDEAPLGTRGLCLVAETGVGRGGKLLCGARFEWTRRACGCFGENVHDEL